MGKREIEEENVGKRGEIERETGKNGIDEERETKEENVEKKGRGIIRIREEGD